MNNNIENLINTINNKIKSFGLPLIVIGENSEEVVIKKRLDSIEKYIDIITKFINNTIEDNDKIFIETHHILPRGFGGSDDTSNLVNLPVKEHILCHIYLSFAYPDNIPAVTAAWFMTSLKKKDTGAYKNNLQKMRQEVIDSEIDIDIIALCRENYLKIKRSKEWHDTHSGVHAPNFGKKFSEETRKKIGIASGKRRHTEESRKKMSMSRMGEKNWSFGKEKPEGQRKKLSKSVKAVWKEHPELFSNCTVKIVSPDGTVFNTIREAAKAYGMKASVLGQTLNKNLDRKGWKYFDQDREKLREKDVIERKSVKNKGFHEVVSPDGTIYPSIKDASIFSGINYSALRIRLQRLHKQILDGKKINVKNKWRFIEDDK